MSLDAVDDLIPRPCIWSIDCPGQCLEMFYQVADFKSADVGVEQGVVVRHADDVEEHGVVGQLRWRVSVHDG